MTYLIPSGRAPLGQHKDSRPLAWFNTGSPRFLDFSSLRAFSGRSWQIWLAEIKEEINCVCSESVVWPEVAIPSAGQWGAWPLETRMYYDLLTGSRSLIICDLLLLAPRETRTLWCPYGEVLLIPRVLSRFLNGIITIVFQRRLKSCVKWMEYYPLGMFSMNALQNVLSFNFFHFVFFF